MSFGIQLPLSETLVMLTISDQAIFDQNSIPPVFRPLDSDRFRSSDNSYSISLDMADDNRKTEGILLLNYRDVVQIYQNGKHLSVEIPRSVSEDIQVFANMGISLALCHILCRENIYLLHAASVVRDSKGFLFPGYSGTGKTTISRLSAIENQVLCDESTALTFCNSNLDNSPGVSYGVFSGPRWDKFTFDPEFYFDSAWQDEPNQVYPLKAIIFPSRSDLRDETWLEKMNSIDAALSLVMQFINTPFVKTLPSESHRKAFHFFSQLARSVPSYTIHANIHTDIWKTIDETIGK